MNKKSCIVVNKSIGCKFIWFSCIVAFLIASSMLTFSKSFVVSMLILLCVLFWLFFYCLIEIDLFTSNDSKKWSKFTPIWSCYTTSILIVLIVWFFVFVYPPALNSSSSPFLLNLTLHVVGKSSCTNNANAAQIGIAYNPNGFLSYTSPTDLLRPFLLCPHPNLNWANSSGNLFNGPLASTNRNDYAMNLGKGITDGWGISKLSTATSFCPRVSNLGVGMPICTQCTQEFIRIGKIPTSSNAANCPPTSSISCNLCPGYDSSSSWNSDDQRLVATLLFVWLIIITISTPLCICFPSESTLINQRINTVFPIPTRTPVIPYDVEESGSTRKRSLKQNESNFQSDFIQKLNELFLKSSSAIDSGLSTTSINISEIHKIPILKWCLDYYDFFRNKQSNPDQKKIITEFEKIIKQLPNVDGNHGKFFPIENVNFLKYLMYEGTTLIKYKNGIQSFSERIHSLIKTSQHEMKIEIFLKVFRITDKQKIVRSLEYIGFEIVQFLIEFKLKNY